MPGREAAFVSLLLLPLGCFAFVSLEEEAKRASVSLLGPTAEEHRAPSWVGAGFCCARPRDDSPGWLRTQRSPVNVFWGPRQLNHTANEGKHRKWEARKDQGGLTI